jgi:hypothetical protein
MIPAAVRSNSIETATRMNAICGGSRPGRRAASTWVQLALAASAVVVALAGCSSSKPAYCTDRANLQNSVKGLTSLNVTDVDSVKSQVQKIESDATALVNSAKSDFPSQTSAISSSIDALKSSVRALASSPSVADIATVTKNAAGVVSSVKSFTDATSSQCG